MNAVTRILPFIAVSDLRHSTGMGSNLRGYHETRHVEPAFLGRPVEGVQIPATILSLNGLVNHGDSFDWPPCRERDPGSDCGGEEEGGGG